VEHDSAMTFVTDGSCFLFRVNILFLCHNATQTLPQQKKYIYMWRKIICQKNTCRRIYIKQMFLPSRRWWH